MTITHFRRSKNFGWKTAIDHSGCWKFHRDSLTKVSGTQLQIIRILDQVLEAGVQNRLCLSFKQRTIVQVQEWQSPRLIVDSRYSALFLAMSATFGGLSEPSVFGEAIM
jgi:hypothetical protein